MLSIQQTSVGKKPGTGTPGSGAMQRGFDVQVTTKPKMEAYRVAMVWTHDDWRTTYRTEAKLANDSMDSEQSRDLWKISVAFCSDRPVTFHYALVAAGPAGCCWDNNNGWNYTV